MNELRSLTIKQPWAWLIVHGHKDVENRTWKTSYRGPFLVHAAASVGPVAAFNDLCDNIEEEMGLTLPQNFDLGCFVGMVDLRDIVTGHRSKWASETGYNWVLANPAPFPHVAYKGKLGLWKVTTKDIPQLQPHIDRWVKTYK